MPEPTHEAYARQEKLNSGEAPAFEGSSVCPICMRAHEPRAADPGDRGKALAEDGVIGKELANDASSSSTVVQTQDEALADGVADTELANGATSSSTISQIWCEGHAEDGVTDLELASGASSSSPGNKLVSICTPHREATETAIRQPEPRLFQDLPGQANATSGLGLCTSLMLMGLPEELDRGVLDPVEIPHQQVQELVGDELLPQPPRVVTVPGFQIGQAGGIVPFADEQFADEDLERGDLVRNP